MTKCSHVLGGSNTFSAYVNLQEVEKCNQNKWGLGGECWEAHQRGMGNTLSISDLRGTSAEGGYLLDRFRPTKKPHQETVGTS